MPPTEYVVATYAVETAGSLLMAYVLLRLHTTYSRQYLLHFAWSWLALGVYFVAGMLALQAAGAGFVAWHPIRLVLTPIELIAALWQVAWVLFGTAELVLDHPIKRKYVTVALAALGVAGLAQSLVYAFDPTASLGRYWVRFGLRALIVGIAFLVAAVLLRRAGRTRGLGRRMVTIAFVLYGVQQLHEFALATVRVVTGEPLGYAVYLAFVEFFLLVVLGLGTVVWLLEAERDTVLRAAEQISFLSNHDTATGLPNRSRLVEQIDIALAGMTRTTRQLAVVVVDVDAFADLNDLVGRGVADELLGALGRRIRRVLGPEDAVARVGNDQFGVLLHAPDRAGIGARVARVQDATAKPFLMHGHEFHITVGIGAAIFPSHGASAEILLRNAEAALHAAQRQGRSRVQFYSPELSSLSAAGRLALENSLRRAIDNGGLALDFQSIVDLRTDEPIAAEALVRWRHPERGTLLPREFLHVAEASGLLDRLESWVLEAAIRQAAAWAGAGALRIAVNLSPQAIQKPDLVRRIALLLDSAGYPATRLQVELTENIAIVESEEARETLQRLRKMGVTVAIDDFGTGYSSLSQLRDLPFDLIKIDRSFTRDLTTDPRSVAMVRAIVTLAGGFGLPIVAEGIESTEQRRLVTELGCQYGQGFLFARPMSGTTWRRVELEDPDRTGAGNPNR